MQRRSSRLEKGSASVPEDDPLKECDMFCVERKRLWGEMRTIYKNLRVPGI